MIPNCSPNQIYTRSRTTASRKVGLETGRLDRKTRRLDWIFNRPVSLPRFPHTVLASFQDLVMAEGHRYTLVAQLDGFQDFEELEVCMEAHEIKWENFYRRIYFFRL
ncbi:uncharacterized protein LOC110877077 [Helianthus annuus]|uniref:uncharacterized protein LOC110877077 n=1 Tax=Helianthus annuus TaxID=4232 RepID=UPI000B8EEC30|nr:uncharacterized protein LOC110877077 [Helianthus annuus]